MADPMNSTSSTNDPFCFTPKYPTSDEPQCKAPIESRAPENFVTIDDPVGPQTPQTKDEFVSDPKTLMDQSLGLGTQRHVRSSSGKFKEEAVSVSQLQQRAKVSNAKHAQAGKHDAKVRSKLSSAFKGMPDMSKLEGDNQKAFNSFMNINYFNKHMGTSPSTKDTALFLDNEVLLRQEIQTQLKAQGFAGEKLEKYTDMMVKSFEQRLVNQVRSQVYTSTKQGIDKTIKRVDQLSKSPDARMAVLNQLASSDMSRAEMTRVLRGLNVPPKEASAMARRIVEFRKDPIMMKAIASGKQIGSVQKFDAMLKDSTTSLAGGLRNLKIKLTNDMAKGDERIFTDALFQKSCEQTFERLGINPKSTPLRGASAVLANSISDQKTRETVERWMITGVNMTTSGLASTVISTAVGVMCDQDKIEASHAAEVAGTGKHGIKEKAELEMKFNLLMTLVGLNNGKSKAPSGAATTFTQKAGSKAFEASNTFMKSEAKHHAKGHL